jgi:hypothetical protein
VSIDSEEITALVIEITEYFETHPNAADNLEGVISWWLIPKEKVISKQSVLLALQCLCDKGLVIKTASQFNKEIYSCANILTSENKTGSGDKNG